MSVWYQDHPAAVERFYTTLQAAIERSGRSLADIGRETGIDSRTMTRWIRDKLVPSVESGKLMADALMDDGILATLIAARTRCCADCSNYFVVPGKPTDYCSNACAQRGARKKHREIKADHSLRVARNAARRYRAAVEQYCHGCEPMGVCVNADCELRPVSPLPLQTRRPVH